MMLPGARSAHEGRAEIPLPWREGRRVGGKQEISRGKTGKIKSLEMLEWGWEAHMCLCYSRRRERLEGRKAGAGGERGGEEGSARPHGSGGSGYKGCPFPGEQWEIIYAFSKRGCMMT